MIVFLMCLLKFRRKFLRPLQSASERRQISGKIQLPALRRGKFKRACRPPVMCGKVVKGGEVAAHGKFKAEFLPRRGARGVRGKSI